MNLGTTEILMIVVIILLFFGPSKLPSIGKSIGEGIRGFKKGMNDMQDGMNDIEKKAKHSQSRPRQDFPGATPEAAPDERVTQDVMKEPVGGGDRKDS